MLPRSRENILLNFEFKNEATRANLQANKRTLKGQPFWNKVYGEADREINSHSQGCFGQEGVKKCLASASDECAPAFFILIIEQQ